MIEDLINYLMITSVFVGIFFVVFTLYSKERKDNSLIYLNLIVVFFCLNNLQIVLLDNVFTTANFFIRNLLIPFYSLIVPSFYIFIKYYLRLKEKIGFFDIAIFTSFIIQLIIRIILGYYFYDSEKCEIVAQYSQIEEIVNALVSLYLFFKSFQLLFIKKKMHETILSFDKLLWLKKFMLLGSLILICWIGAIVLNIDKVLNPNIFIYYPLRLSSSVLLFWLGFQGYYNYNLLNERIQIRKLIAEEQNDLVEHKNDIVENENKLSKKSNFTIINDYIVTNRCYFNPDFSLELLSKELKISISTLSNSINKESGYNFSDYINSFRIEKAKEYLLLEEFKDYTIVAIGLECGFNSKSVFYNSFKKFTGITPSEFRKKAL